MTSIQRELLEIVRAWLNGENIPETKNQAKIYALAQRHGLVNVLYLAIKDAGWEQSVFESLRRNYRANLHQQISQEFYAETIFEKFREKKIRYMPLKGYILKHYYPVSEARISCDVDVFYDKSRKEEVDEILQELGFERGPLTDDDESWFQGSITIEMHFGLVAHYRLYEAYYQNAWERLISDDGCSYRFTKEDFYIYFIVHTAKHFYHSGLGVRFILDLAMLRRNMDGVNEAYIKAELKKLELDTLAEKLEELARVWFDGEEETQESKLIGDYVFNCSLYGNSQNLAAAQADNEKGEVGEKTVKRTLLKNRFFPSARMISDRYTVLKKHPYLLPFVWVWRWIDILLFRRKSIKNTINVYNALDEKQIKQRTAVMNAVKLKIDQLEED
jgi:hypothetical protein